MEIVAIVLASYVALGLGVDAAIGCFQPEAEGTAILRTFDASGQSEDTVLGLLEDDVRSAFCLA